MVNSPLQLLHISFEISCKNVVYDQDNNFYLMFEHSYCLFAG